MDDLHDVLWENIRYKRNMDHRWELWKTYFLEVLDKHVPKRVKTLRKKANVTWVNGDVKPKLFKSDALKLVAF